MVVSVTLGFILYASIGQSERFLKKRPISRVNFLFEEDFVCVCVPKFACF